MPAGDRSLGFPVPHWALWKASSGQRVGRPGKQLPRSPSRAAAGPHAPGGPVRRRRCRTPPCRAGPAAGRAVGGLGALRQGDRRHSANHFVSLDRQGILPPTSCQNGFGLGLGQGAEREPKRIENKKKGCLFQFLKLSSDAKIGIWMGKNQHYLTNQKFLKY